MASVGHHFEWRLILRRVRCLAGGVLLFAVLVSGCSSDKGVTGDPPGDPLGADFYPAWSPDGRTVAFVSEDLDSSGQPRSLLLNTIDVSTAVVDTIVSVEGMGINSLSWSPDGRWLLLSAEAGIWKMFSDGDSLTQLTEGQFHVSPCWSRSSNAIFYAINAGDEMGIYSMNPDGSDQVRRTHPDGQVVFTAPNCFPDSDTLSGYSVRDDGRCIALYYPGDQELFSVPKCGFLWLWAVKMSPGKRYIAFNANLTDVNEIHLYVIDRTGGSLRALVEDKTGDFAFSPDGERIVFPDFGETRGLQIVDVETGEVTQLTPGR